MKRTSIFLSKEDKDAIEIIKARYGVSTDSDAIRLALRVLASSPLLQLRRGDRRDDDK